MLSDKKFEEIFPLDKPRDGQREIIESIISAYQSGKKYVILDAPTGIGKSVIGYSIARYFGEAYILTSQKILQDQYFKDFKIPFILGRANYTCRKNNNFTCDMGACFRNPKSYCKDSNGIYTCPYLIDKEICLRNNYSNLNYSYFLSITKFGKLEPRKLIICDESHGLESELIRQCSIKITEKSLTFNGIMNEKLPMISDSDGNKCNWLINTILEKAKIELANVRLKVSKMNSMKMTREYKILHSRFQNLETLVISIETLKEQILNTTKGSKEQRIIITHTPEFIEFKPLYGINTFKSTINKYGEFFLFMSATILNKDVFCKNLGINPKDAEYIRCESTFPVKNRLINFNPVGSMSFKNKNTTMPLLIKEIDNILKKHPNVKGIIHTVNYEIAEKIIEGLSFSNQSSRLIYPVGADRQIMLDTFYASKKPYVLISPSLMEGIDLKEDLSRLCIICKIPYLNLGDNWTKERMSIDPEWYTTMACVHLIQMTGRSIRSETDYAETYILDKDFLKLAHQSVNIFPKWWQDSVIIN